MLGLKEATRLKEATQSVVAVDGLAVNAAFLAEIKADNQQLRKLRTAATMAIRSLSPRTNGFFRSAQLLQRLLDQLAMHFALEEAFGYFEDAVEVQPHLAERAECLLKDHAALYLQLGRIVETGQDLAYRQVRRTDRIIRRHCRAYEAFDSELTDHERGERELIMESIQQDIGVGD